ncbi:MAG: 50S ribosomal protein L17 [Patescibacteria group bacterium]|nr:50S ribosomal protein L17 [Patescibacteria group bacterium]
MRHHNANRKFHREEGERLAFLRSLARSLIQKGKITTTEARAKELRPIVEKLVTRGKNPTLSNRRVLIARLGGDTATAKKIEAVANNYKTRAGGYLRVVKLGARKSDGSPMAVIEFV